MVKVVVLFGHPVDRSAFEQHFEEVYRPLLIRVPELEALDVYIVSGAAVGDSPFHLVVELQFPSEKSMQTGLNSDVGRAMASELGQFASGGATVLFCNSYVGPS